jgi:hypothetical protein
MCYHDPVRSPLLRTSLSQHSTSPTPEDSSKLQFQYLCFFRGLLTIATVSASSCPLRGKFTTLQISPLSRLRTAVLTSLASPSHFATESGGVVYMAIRFLPWLNFHQRAKCTFARRTTIVLICTEIFLCYDFIPTFPTLRGGNCEINGAISQGCILQIFYM